MSSSSPPPPGGDHNRAGEIYAFTWSLEIISLIFVVGRMYSRTKLTRNVWWDDWCVCFALMLDFVVAIMWSMFAASGYARHLYYLTPAEIPKALELNTISRSLCMLSIATGKISVAFLIERIAGPSDWRKWLLRGISITVFVSAVITFALFYAQCQPARAIWDKSMIEEGTGHCWNPIPVNTWNLVIASYWAFLDFALALIPVDIVWKLQLTKQKKLLLTMLLGMGVFAGACAAVKTSKVPITVKAAKTDITWQTVELLMWNGIEMNVIIIAACIPTLRPIFLVLCRRPGIQVFRASVRERGHSSYYYRSADCVDSKRTATESCATNKAFDQRASRVMTGSTEAINKGSIDGGGLIQVESREVGSREGGLEEEEWGHAKGSGVPMTNMWGDRREGNGDAGRLVEDTAV